MIEDGFDTLCAHFGEDPSLFRGAIAPPIVQTSLFVSPNCEAFFDRAKRFPELYDYTRVNNPTTDIFEAKVAALERTEDARAFGSGMGAVSAAILSCCRSGDHIVAVDTCYGPTRSFLTDYANTLGIEVTYIPGDDPGQFEAACRPNTTAYYLESPSSLVFHLQDLEAVCQIAKDRSITTICDNSWASPYFQNPCDFGVDLVLHSATKYLGGHSDVVAGVVAGKKDRISKLREREGCLLGAVLDPFAAWLLIRGMRTLSVRLERHQLSASVIAEYLESHPKVASVHYPGLSSHPQFELAARQMRGSSGLLSFALKDGTKENAFKFVDALNLFSIGVSWGGYESLAIPVGFDRSSGHSKPWLPGIGARPDQLGWGSRIHVGLETVSDLIEDLDQALARV